MNRHTATFTETHFYIRWLMSNSIDWERHNTRAQAEEAAEQLSRTDEKYMVEQFNEPCVRCTQLAGRP